MKRALLVLGLVAFSTSAQAQITNFSQDVASSIDAGLGWLDAQGAFNNPSSAGDAAGLVALALLEKRDGADQRAVTIGYAGANAADQARIDRVMAFIIARSTNANFGAYRDGADMMSLVVYLRTGGPNAAGALAAANNIVDRIARNQNGAGYWCYTNGACNDSSTTQLVNAGLAAARGLYNDPAFADPGRLATVNQLTANSRQGYVNNGRAGDLGNFERGHGYNSGNAVSYQQTASGLWGMIIGGADLNDDMVQRYLTWLRNHYKYDSINPHRNSWTQSYHYYLWSSTKAYTFIEDSGVVPNGNNLGTDAIGALPAGDAPAWNERATHIDPANAPRVRWGNDAAGFYLDQHEPARWYFDYAYTLMQYQAQNGQFGLPNGMSRWNNYSSQAYALLVLLRSVGGGCVDTDNDGICDGDDNCAQVANPLQEDIDQDGIGDICDLCPAAPNPDQDDSDGDSYGDACDTCPEIFDADQSDVDGDGVGDLCDNCIDTPNPLQEDADDDLLGDACDECAGDPREEICNAVDDDCDGFIDENLAGAGDGGACDTGLPGVCAEGNEVCDGGGGFVCEPLIAPSPEICDGLDNDCDGSIDEEVNVADMACATGLPGICAAGMGACLDGAVRCTPDAQAMDEACDGLDNDCDGTIDENLRNACGRCGPLGPDGCDGIDNDCDGTIDEDAQCPTGQDCLGGICRDPCNNFECPGLLVCVDGFCVDRCDAILCEAGQSCEEGECFDPCAGVQCPGGQACAEGDCVPDNCFGLGCPDGERCNDDGACEGDPCAEVDCVARQFCRDGDCIESCADISCPLGESCRDGLCVADPCAEVDCAAGEICREGACVGDPCLGIDCPTGLVCSAGACIGDPCASVRCPAGESCVIDAAGVAQCALDYVDPGAGGAGGDPGAGGEGGEGGGMGGNGGGMGGNGGGDPQPDGGVTTPEFGPPGAGGAGGGTGGDPVEEGCSQAAVGHSSPAPWMLLLLGAPVALRRRRR